MTRGWPAMLTAVAVLMATPAAALTRPAGSGWIGSWGAAQIVPEAADAFPAGRASGVTLRQVVRLSAGGDRVRVRFSNAFGTTPLVIGGAHIARVAVPGAAPGASGGAARTDAGTDDGVALAFAGRGDAVIPPGAELYADPVAFRVAPGADLAIALYLPDAASLTGHRDARVTGVAIAGAHLAGPVPAGATAITQWYGLADVEVAGAGTTATVVTIGDSITDGFGIPNDSNLRWPDILAERLRAAPATRGIGVVNAGIGGNRVLRDGVGPNLLARFDRDVIARSGVRWAILLEGVNDLGVLARDAPVTPAQHAEIVTQITAGYRQLVARAHAHGIRVVGGTILPFVENANYHPGAAGEADRQAINRFIRTSGLFDGVVDFDRALRDPAHPDRMAPAFDSGDHLHPSVAGYRAMAAAVPLALFADAARPPKPDPRPATARTPDDIPAHAAPNARGYRIAAVTTGFDDLR